MFDLIDLSVVIYKTRGIRPNLIDRILLREIIAFVDRCGLPTGSTSCVELSGRPALRMVGLDDLLLMPI